MELARAVEAAGATIINTGIGWHEARVPTIATSVPRAAFAWVTRKLKGAVEHPALHHQPDQHAGGGRGAAGRGRRRPGLDGAAAAGRPGAGQQGGGRAGRRDQHLHRLQPGLPRPRLQPAALLLPGQPARLPRDRAQLPPGGEDEADRRGRRRPGRPLLRHRGRRARPPGDALRGGRRDRRPVRHGQPRAGQGGVPRDAPLLPAPAGGDRGGGPARRARHRRGAAGRRLRRGGAGHRRGAARPGHPRAAAPQGPLLRRRAAARRRRWARAWRWWAPAASASTSPSSWSTPRRRPARRCSAGWPSGAWPIRSGPAAAWSSRRRSRRPARSGCCSARPAAPAPAWARPPAGSTGPRSR